MQGPEPRSVRNFQSTALEHTRGKPPAPEHGSQRLLSPSHPQRLQGANRLGVETAAGGNLAAQTASGMGAPSPSPESGGLLGGGRGAGGLNLELGAGEQLGENQLYPINC